jgi:hypothetical protein
MFLPENAKATQFSLHYAMPLPLKKAVRPLLQRVPKYQKPLRDQVFEALLTTPYRK